MYPQCPVLNFWRGLPGSPGFPEQQLPVSDTRWLGQRSRSEAHGRASLWPLWQSLQRGGAGGDVARHGSLLSLSEDVLVLTSVATVKSFFQQRPCVTCYETEKADGVCRLLIAGLHIRAQRASAVLTEGKQTGRISRGTQHGLSNSALWSQLTNGINVLK